MTDDGSMGNKLKSNKALLVGISKRLRADTVVATKMEDTASASKAKRGNRVLPKERPINVNKTVQGW